MEIQQIKTKRLLPNEGQIEGLPTNPRQIKKKAFDSLKKSIKDAPEMLHLRELIVYPYGDDFVVIGGNMRLRACRELGFEELPCKVLPAETPAEKLREYAIKDNVEAGEDDWDVLANEWNAEELTEWGMDLPIEDKLKKLQNGEVEGEVPFTEVLNEEHNYIVLYFDNNVDWLQAQSLFEINAVKALPTQKEGNSDSFGEKYGVGRVINGAIALEKIRKQYEHIN